MERHCKREKHPRAGKKKESCEKRSPLQNLNRLPILKSKTKKSSILSSSSTSSSSASAVSGEPPNNGYLKFVLSSNSCSSSSSSRTLLDKKPKTFSKIAIKEPNKSTPARSKENEIPRKPFLQKSEKNQPQLLRQYGRSNRKRICKSGQRPKLSSVQGNPENKLKKGSLEFQAKMKNSQENGSGNRAFELLGVSNGSNLSFAENCAPVGRLASGYSFDSLNFGGHETVMEDSVYERANGNSVAAVKTPPIEASLSPEIQCQSRSKMLVVESGATPFCYGAGHLVSGVTDRRKCRRRGSLRGGPEKATLFYYKRSDMDVTNDSEGSLVPLLAEASVRWHSSPCNEGHADQGTDSGNRFDQCRMVRDDAFGKLDVLSSHSMLCGNVSDSLCAESSYSGSGSVGNVGNERRNKNVSYSGSGSVGNVGNERGNKNAISSWRKASAFQGPLEPSNCNMVESLLATSPNAAYSGVDIISGEGIHFSENMIGDTSRLSIGSLNSGNIIQTPDSDSGSDVCVGRSRLEVNKSNFVWPELDSITETLERVKLSPSSQMSMWDTPSLGLHFADMASPPVSVVPTQLQKNAETVYSWVSDATFSNLSLSQMRISWRDGLGSRIVETDELDCCCFLSDEEINADGPASEKLTLHLLTEAAEDKESSQDNNNCQRTSLELESVENKENHLSPMLLDYEPLISAGGRDKSSSHKSNTCAESIFDGGGLVASDDSDWTYFHENHLFQVK